MSDDSDESDESVESHGSTSRDWRRVGHYGAVLALVLVVAPFAAFIFPQLVGASNAYVVVSDSMSGGPAPVLVAGDVVYVYDTPPEQIEVGDVITYRSGADQLTTHRVVGVENEDGLAFETKGDANEEADPTTVAAANVVGTVGFHVPAIGRVIVFAGTTQGTVALVVVPMALLVLSELFDIVRVARAAPGPVAAGDIEDGDTNDDD